MAPIKAPDSSRKNLRSLRKPPSAFANAKSLPILLSVTARIANSDFSTKQDTIRLTWYGSPNSLSSMRLANTFCATILAIASFGCTNFQNNDDWKSSVNYQTGQLGYRNWIVIAEASFPAHSRRGIRQVNANAEIPEVVDYVLNALESTQHVRPKIYLPRELRAVENEFAPGIDQLRQQIIAALHAHEPTELDQQSLLTLLESSTQNFDVLVIRTPTALPYSSVFIELHPGYWDAESEDRLRERIQQEQAEKIKSPAP